MASTGGRKTRKKPRKKRKGTSPPQWKSVLWIAGGSVLVVAVLWWLLVGGPKAPDRDLGEVETALRSMAADHGVTANQIDADTEIRKVDGVFVRTWELRFPSRASREEFIAELMILGDRDEIDVGQPVDMVGRVVGLRVDHGVEAFDLQLSVLRQSRAYSDPATIAPVSTPPRPDPTSTPRPTPPPHARGRLAILLDDGGQSMSLVSRAARLPAEIGFAILPFLPYSVETAVELHEAGHEVWLHLPMEAVGGNDPGPGALMMAMSDDELRDTVHLAINNIPNLVGVNNHMGSKATANLRMMTWVMQELAAMDLAFIDSRTTVDTVAEEAARAQGVATGRRHVFLDNDRNEAAVRRQLDEAVYRARVEGDIIAIGHLTEVTVKVLEKELSGLSKRGADLVAPLELLN
jgi:polysaccharide deacetylase 2 family uncharacterized protein YibQ